MTRPGSATPDLFAPAPSYPDAPGFKARDTSRQAAAMARPSAATNRAMVLRAIEARGASTCEELAVWLRWDINSVRPRVTELSRLHKIHDSGLRRPSRTARRRSIVWTLGPAPQINGDR